ncbi:MAG: hypothetical protein DRI93_03805 [Aquificota bacterium]|nr:MAG: hypothetical protein DRI93_03805 [Aquificota bacterium]
MKGQKWKWLFVCLISLSLTFVFSLSSWAIENSECLDCHGDPDMVKELPNGKTASLYVNPDKFAASVHGQNDIACTDCHSSITELNYEEEVPHPIKLEGVHCSDCHDEEAEAYSESVHAKARETGNKKAPTCQMCHTNYHYVRPITADTVTERENAFCVRCHDPSKFHEWLPQKETHFLYAECTVCHSEGVEKHVHLRPFDLIKNDFIPGTKIVKVLNTSFDDFMSKVDTNKNGILDIPELRKLRPIFKKAGINPTLWGELAVKIDPASHNITKGQAIKDCLACHSSESPIFKKVFLVLTKPDGEAPHYPVDPYALRSVHITHFYLLDTTRVSILDIIGLIILLGGIAFAGGHLTLRILTIPVRKKRKEGK